MREYYYFNRYLESSLALHLFSLEEICNQIDEKLRIGRCEFLIQDGRDTQKWYSDCSENEFNGLDDFINYYHGIFDPFLLKFEFSNDDIHISIDDDAYVVIWFDKRQELDYFVMKLLKEYNLYSKEAFDLITSSYGEKCYRIGRDGQITQFNNWDEMWLAME